MGDDKQGGGRSGGSTGGSQGKGGFDPLATRPLPTATAPEDPWSQDLEDMATRPAIPSMFTQPLHPKKAPAKTPAPRAPAPQKPAPKAPAPQKAAPRSRSPKPAPRAAASEEPFDPWAQDVEDMATRVVPRAVKAVAPDALSTLPHIPRAPVPKRAPTPKAKPSPPKARRSLYRSPDLDAHSNSSPGAPSAFDYHTQEPTDALATYIEPGASAAKGLSGAAPSPKSSLGPKPPRTPKPPVGGWNPAGATPQAFDDVERTLLSGNAYEAAGRSREDEPTFAGDDDEAGDAYSTLSSGQRFAAAKPRETPSEPTATAELDPSDAGDPMETRLGAAVAPQALATRQLATPPVPEPPPPALGQAWDEEEPPWEDGELEMEPFDWGDPEPGPPTIGRQVTQDKSTAMIPVAPAMGNQPLFAPVEELETGAQAAPIYGADLRFQTQKEPLVEPPSPRAGAPDVGTFIDDAQSTSQGPGPQHQPTFNWGDDDRPQNQDPGEGEAGKDDEDAMDEYRRKQRAKAHWYGSYTAYDIPVAMHLSPGLIPAPLPIDKLGEWVRGAWDAFLDDPVSFVLAQVMVMAMLVFSAGLLIGPAMTGYLHYMGRIVRGEEDANPFDIFDPFSRFGQSFLMGLFVWVFLGGVFFSAALVGFLLDMIPYLGFFLQLVLNLAATVAVAAAFPIISLSFALMWNRDPGVQMKDLFLAVLRLLGQDPQAALVYGVTAGLLGAAGSLGFGFGILLTGPMAVWIMAMAYDVVFESDRERLEAEARANMTEL